MYLKLKEGMPLHIAQKKTIYQHSLSGSRGLAAPFSPDASPEHLLEGLARGLCHSEGKNLETKKKATRSTSQHPPFEKHAADSQTSGKDFDKATPGPDCPLLGRIIIPSFPSASWNPVPGHSEGKNLETKKKATRSTSQHPLSPSRGQGAETPNEWQAF